MPTTSILDTHPSRDDGMPPEPHRPHRLMGNLHSIPQTSGQPSITTFQPLFFSLDSDDTFTIAAAPTTAVPETTERLTQYSTAPIRQSRRCRCRCHVSPPPRTQHVKLEPHVHRLPWSCPVPTQCPPSCGGCLSRGAFHPKVQRDLDSLSLPTLASLANSSISVQSSPNHEMHPSLPRTLLVSSPSQRRALMPPPPRRTVGVSPSAKHCRPKARHAWVDMPKLRAGDARCAAGGHVPDDSARKGRPGEGGDASLHQPRRKR